MSSRKIYVTFLSERVGLYLSKRINPFLSKDILGKRVIEILEGIITGGIQTENNKYIMTENGDNLIIE